MNVFCVFYHNTSPPTPLQENPVSNWTGKEKKKDFRMILSVRVVRAAWWMMPFTYARATGDKKQARR